MLYLLNNLGLYLLREDGSGCGHRCCLAGCEGAAGGDSGTDVSLGRCGDSADGGPEGGEADVRAEIGHGGADHGHDRESDERHLDLKLRRRQNRHANGKPDGADLVRKIGCLDGRGLLHCELRVRGVDFASASVYEAAECYFRTGRSTVLK